MKQQGTFIISLDFELNWGVHDVFTSEQYRENLLGTREAIDELLKLFDRYEIRATWATVGMLSFKSKDELLKNLPALYPSYTNGNFSPYGKLDLLGDNEDQDPFHFGHSLIAKISRHEGQEIASHTFSHYYCLEEGQTAAQFEADLVASIKAKKVFGHQVKSIVFPRNQLNRTYLSICKKHGIKSYRGNEKSWIYKESKFHEDCLLKRVIRLADCYVNLTGHNTYKLKDMVKKPLLNLPSSRFLRPYNPKLKVIEKLRLRRIKAGIRHAAQNGEVYHLWWHPHNFGKDINENIQFLTKILKLVEKLNKVYGFASLTMSETTQLAHRLDEEKTYEENKAPVTL